MTAPRQWPTQVCTCGKPYIMCRTEKGGWMPVDPAPVEQGGNITLRDYGVENPTAVVLNVRQQFGRALLHQAHFVTCPDAKKHRRTGDRRYGS